MEIEKEIQKYTEEIKKIQEEINKIDMRKNELLKMGFRIEGILSYLNGLLNDKNKSDSGSTEN